MEGYRCRWVDLSVRRHLQFQQHRKRPNENGIGRLGVRVLLRQRKGSRWTYHDFQEKDTVTSRHNSTLRYVTTSNVSRTLPVSSPSVQPQFLGVSAGGTPIGEGPAYHDIMFGLTLM